MALPRENFYTIDDIYALPDGKRAEMIDGQIYYMAPPSRKHQKITGRLYQEIANYISRKGGPCEVYVSPFAVFLNKNDTNYVEPDVSVIWINWMIKDAMEPPTGLSRLYLQAAAA